MIEEGTAAPRFELPAVVEGSVRQVALTDSLGSEVVVLAFYPGDFNPACDGERTGLDDLGLFTMQKDVRVLAISGDSVHSHRAFAAEYDLRVPLLSDHGEVAEAYGVVADAETHRTRRAVVVVSPSGEVVDTWEATAPTELPDVDAVREAVEAVGGSDAARARYDVGHAHYVEGRRAFTRAMGSFEEREWTLARSEFERAAEEFGEAADAFDTAARFGADGEVVYFERADRKATALHRAAEWLGESAAAYAGGEGAEGDSLRSDAETPLETARDVHEPVPPTEFPPETDPAGDGSSRPPEEAGTGAASLDSLDADEEGATAVASESSGSDEATGTETEEDAAEIDEAELAEITAELEEQTAATRDAPDGTGGSGVGGGAEETAGDAPAETDEEEPVELDLTDPTDGDEDEEEPVDLGDGDHGVPDSL